MKRQEDGKIGRRAWGWRSTAVVFVLSAALAVTGLAVDYAWDGTINDWNTAHWNGGDPYADAGDVGNVNSGDVYALPGTEFVGRLNINTGGTLRYNHDNGVGPVCTNIHMNGGTLRPHTGNDDLQGKIYVDAVSYLLSGVSGIACEILGSGDLEKTDAGDWLRCVWDASAWTGRLIISDGMIGVHGDVVDMGSHEVILSATGELRLWLEPVGGWNVKNDWLGSGKVGTINGEGMILQGAQIKPGDTSSGSGAGVLTFESFTGGPDAMPTTLVLDGAGKCRLVVDIVGGGAVAGTDYDQLKVSNGTVTGLSNMDLSVLFSGSVGGAALAGDTLTILTTTSDLTGQSFNSVTMTAGWTAAVNYNNGSVTLTDIQRTTSGMVIRVR